MTESNPPSGAAKAVHWVAVILLFLMMAQPTFDNVNALITGSMVMGEITVEVTFAKMALHLLASRADGALRDAESLLDQVASFGSEVSQQSAEQVLGLVDRVLYFELVAAIAAAAPERVLDIVARAFDAGADVEEFVHGLVELLRHLLFALIRGGTAELDVAEEDRARYAELAAAFAEEDVLRMMQSLLDLEADMKRSVQPRFRVEIALVHLALMGRAVDVSQLLLRLQALEHPAKGRGGKLAGDEADGAGVAHLRLLSYPLLREAGEGAVLFGKPGGELLDVACQREVLVGDTSGTVGLELDDKPGPSHLEIRVMEARLRPVADGVDQHQGMGPAGCFEAPPDPAITKLPAGQLPEFFNNLLFAVYFFFAHLLGSCLKTMPGTLFILIPENTNN